MAQRCIYETMTLVNNLDNLLGPPKVEDTPTPDRQPLAPEVVTERTTTSQNEKPPVLTRTTDLRHLDESRRMVEEAYGKAA